MQTKKNKSDTKYKKMKKSLISIRDFSKDEILHVLEVAREFEQNRVQKILEGKVIACIFFEPGANQHPSQTLLDLYSIKQTQGKLEDLTINMVGDLKYGRTTHSLLQAMSFFNPRFIFTAPEELKMPVEYKKFLDEKHIGYSETNSLEEHLDDCDILYMTRVQQERFTDPMEYEKVKDVYCIRCRE